MTTTQGKIMSELNRATLSDLEVVRWYVLYLKCTPKEREEIAIAMRQRIESRQQESTEIYKRDPNLLTGLSVSALRDVAGRTVEHAHQWMVEHYPGAEDLLNSFECLSSFSTGQDETISHVELSDVIASLKAVWQIVSVETDQAAAR